MLEIGAKIGPYQVLELLGAGGMGEVYKARDSRLDRTVALKVLSADGTGDADHIRRFIQEAKAASALNHPNIVTIYDIGTDNFVDYLAMEMISGKSLDQVIPPGGLALADIVHYGCQIVAALTQAHAAGIVHRDLKPANVMITPAGTAKVVDFGLAKRGQDRTFDGVATVTASPRTITGAIVGTAAYMSPEQAQGGLVDSRSDIFSLGAILYEMATGERAFQGSTQLAILSAVLRDDPDPVNQIDGRFPLEFAQIVSRCLRKDPGKRYQNIPDLQVALEELKEDSEAGRLQPRVSSRRLTRPWLWALPFILLAVGVGYLALRNSSGGVAEKMLAPVPLTSYPGDQVTPSFSPDGNQVAFAWNGDKQDNYDIYVKLLGPGAPLRLTSNAARDFRPKWSPDGRSIAFLRETAEDRAAVMTIPALGGPERKIAEFYTQVRIRMLASLEWTSDSNSLIVSAARGPGQTNRLLLISLSTGDFRSLTEPPPYADDLNPTVSPDGRMIAFRRFDGSVARLFTVGFSADHQLQGDPRVLPAGNVESGLAWTRDGREIVFESGGAHASQAFYRIAASGRDPPVRLTEAGMGVDSPAIAPQGRRLVFERFFQDTNLWAVPLDGRKGHPEKRVPSSAQEVFPQYSPDGGKLAFHSDRGGTVEIWTCNVDGSGCAQLTSAPGSTQGTPRWSPDGRRISFDSSAHGYDIYTINAEGGKPRQMTSGAGINIIASWSHDGHWIYFGSTRSGRFEIWKIPSEGGEAVQVTHNGGTAALESPDGKFLYYTKNNGPDGIWKMPVEGGLEVQVVKAIWRYNFAVTRKGIYYTPPRGANGSSSVQFLNFDMGTTTQIAEIEKPVDLGMAVSPDEKEILFAQIDASGTNLLLIDKFR